MVKLLALVIYVLNILAVIDVWKTGKETKDKFIWTLFILFIPPVGLAVYYLVDKKK